MYSLYTYISTFHITGPNYNVENEACSLRYEGAMTIGGNLLVMEADVATDKDCKTSCENYQDCNYYTYYEVGIERNITR